jgi:hypothetical protein
MSDLFNQPEHIPVKTKGRKKNEDQLIETVKKIGCNCPLIESETMIKNKDILGNPSINYNGKLMWYCKIHKCERASK